MLSLATLAVLTEHPKHLVHTCSQTLLFKGPLDEKLLNYLKATEQSRVRKNRGGGMEGGRERREEHFSVHL